LQFSAGSPEKDRFGKSMVLVASYVSNKSWFMDRERSPTASSRVKILRSLALGFVIVTIVIASIGVVIYANLGHKTNSSSTNSIKVGGGPYGLAYDSQNGNMYVASYYPGTLSVINSSTNSVTSVIKLGFPGSSWGVAFDPSNGFIYVGEAENPFTSVVNTTSKSVVKNIVVGDDLFTGDNDDRPNGIAYDATNQDIYVAIYGTDTLADTNSDTLSLSKNVNLGTTAGLWDVTFNPSNDNLYASNVYTNMVYVVNGATDDNVASIPVQRSPNGIAVDTNPGQSYGEVFVADYSSNSVSVINSSTNVIITTINVGQNPNGIAFDPVTGDFYVANYGGGTVSVINPSTYSVIKTISVGSDPSCVAFDPSNGDIYVTDFGSAAVSVISPSQLVNGT
jgi:YVTN family beta-propeller protein